MRDSHPEMLNQLVWHTGFTKAILDADKFYRYGEHTRQIFCNSPTESTSYLMLLHSYNRSRILRGLKYCHIIQRLHAWAIYYANANPLFFQFSRGQNRIMHQWAAPNDRNIQPTIGGLTSDRLRRGIPKDFCFSGFKWSFV